MLRCQIILCLLLLTSGILSGQDKKVRSSASGKYSKRGDYSSQFLIAAESISLKDPKKALDYVAEALAMSINNNDKVGEALCYKTLGTINYQQGLYQKSVENYQKCIDLLIGLNNRSNLYEIRKLFAPALEANQEYSKALEQWNLILQEARSTSRTEDEVKAKTAIGLIYEKQGKLDLALKKQKEVLKIEEARDNNKGIISANNNIGNIYFQQEKTQQALSHYSKSQTLANEIADAGDITESNEMIGKIYRKEKKYDQELALRMQSIEINKRTNNKEALNEEYLQVAKLYLEQDNSSEAIPYLKQSVALSDQLGNADKKGEAIRNLSDAYGKEGNLNEALKNYKTYVILVDTLYKRKERELASVVHFNQDLVEQQKQIESLEKDRQLNAKTIELLRKEQKLKEESMKKQAILIYALIGGLIIVFTASYLLYKSAQKRRIANQLLALKSLRSQMNPHFIFNALNSVNSFISQNDERSANKYLSEFSKLMRAVMENSQYDFVPISTELKILELYLSLEHFRFKEKFDYSFEVDREIDGDAIQIPPMLIQPYIENAIWHGLRYKENKGSLKVKVSKSNNELRVLIEDDGIGRKKSQQLKTRNQKETVSTGLRNIESRLKIINEIHRTKLSVQIDDLDTENQCGTKVVIIIPLTVKEAIIT